MRLIINVVGIKATGATQVSTSFIKECLFHKENQYFIFLSPTLSRELNISEFPENFHFYNFKSKPFFTLKGIKIWKQLNKLEREIKPDCVFSVFGPDVWKPKSPHLMGYAYAFYVYPDSPFFKLISTKLRFQIWIKKLFYKFFFQKNCKHFVCETEDVSLRLPSYINCDHKNVYTVTNTYNGFFENFKPKEEKKLPEKKGNEFRLVTLSSFATHKNLLILNQVIPILKKSCDEFDFKFVLTVDQYLFEQRFSNEVKDQLINLGRIKVEECPQVYFESDALFLPTLMECFSASYPEAMKMNKPIVTSDLPFAKTVCGNAALYFDPLNPEDIARKIIHLAKNKKLKNELVKKGLDRLNEFDTPQSRAEKYLNLCKIISRV